MDYFYNDPADVIDFHYVAIQTTKSKEFFALQVFPQNKTIFSIIQSNGIVIIITNSEKDLYMIKLTLKKIFNPNDNFDISGIGYSIEFCLDHIQEASNQGKFKLYKHTAKEMIELDIKAYERSLSESVIEDNKKRQIAEKQFKHVMEAKAKEIELKHLQQRQEYDRQINDKIKAEYKIHIKWSKILCRDPEKIEDIICSFTANLMSILIEKDGTIYDSHNFWIYNTAITLYQYLKGLWDFCGRGYEYDFVVMATLGNIEKKYRIILENEIATANYIIEQIKEKKTIITPNDKENIIAESKDVIVAMIKNDIIDFVKKYVNVNNIISKRFVSVVPGLHRCYLSPYVIESNKCPCSYLSISLNHNGHKGPVQDYIEEYLLSDSWLGMYIRIITLISCANKFDDKSIFSLLPKEVLYLVINELFLKI